MTNIDSTPPQRARIQVRFYPGKDGIRWRVRSSARGRRVIADSPQGYTHKADAFRSLLLLTGGRYIRLSWWRAPDRSIYEQGEILRRNADSGLVEAIFVEYLT